MTEMDGSIDDYSLMLLEHRWTLLLHFSRIPRRLLQYQLVGGRATTVAYSLQETTYRRANIPRPL